MGCFPSSPVLGAFVCWQREFGKDLLLHAANLVAKIVGIQFPIDRVIAAKQILLEKTSTPFTCFTLVQQ
jgi:hypothetical protein